MNSVATASSGQNQLLAATNSADRELVLWQRRLLPFMTAFVVAMAGVFFVFSGLHLYQVTAFIETQHGPNIREVIQSEIAKPTADKVTSDEVNQHALLLLEADTLDKRYHQASALLISRIWSRQLAFITGMVMAFLGAVFILGKLSESASQISGSGAELKLAITSASPGIILSFFGTVLLVSSLYVRATLDVIDAPAYVNTLQRPVFNSNATTSSSSKASAESRPLELDELKKLDQQKNPSPPRK